MVKFVHITVNIYTMVLLYKQNYINTVFERIRYHTQHFKCSNCRVLKFCSLVILL